MEGKHVTVIMAHLLFGREGMSAASIADLVTSNEDPTTLFTLQQMLGKGSYGMVYKAVGTGVGGMADTVAIKIIAVDVKDAVDDVRAEIEILSVCKHPNIVNYLGSYLKEGNLWIVMEYCGGGSISDISKIMGTSLTENQIALICREALQGLSYFHSQKKIHRDIKGGNILLTDKGEVKLADFGVSTQLQNTFSNRNTFTGSPYWMAPEIIENTDSYNSRADIWSLGITAIEMAETVPPYADVHPMRVLFMIPAGESPKLKDEFWSANFVDFIASCLKKDQFSRPSADELLQHKFVSNCKGKAVLEDLLEKCQDIASRRSVGLHPPQHVDQGTYVENSFSSGDEMATYVSRGSYSEEFGSIVSSFLYGSDAFDGGTCVSKKFDSNQSYASNESISSIAITSDPKRGFGLQDQLQAIYRKDCCIDIPFLNLNYMNPNFLLTPGEYGASRCIHELCPEQLKAKTDPKSLQKLPATLTNLMRSYAYHKHRQDMVPAPLAEVEQNNRIVSELASSVKTILKV